MFVKKDNAALCIADYKDIKEGAIVPVTNELYAQVEESVAESGWQTLPDGWTPPLPLADAKSQKIQEMINTCHSKIEAGFTSGTYTYPSTLTDQINLQLAAANPNGGSLHRADANGVWSFDLVSRADAIQAVQDFEASKAALQQHLIDLKTRINNKVKTSTVQAVTWESI